MKSYTESETPRGLGTQRESGSKTMAYFRRLWVKEPHHSENIC